MLVLLLGLGRFVSTFCAWNWSLTVAGALGVILGLNEIHCGVRGQGSSCCVFGSASTGCSCSSWIFGWCPGCSTSACRWCSRLNERYWAPWQFSLLECTTWTLTHLLVIGVACGYPDLFCSQKTQEIRYLLYCQDLGFFAGSACFHSLTDSPMAGLGCWVGFHFAAAVSTLSARLSPLLVAAFFLLLTLCSSCTHAPICCAKLDDDCLCNSMIHSQDSLVAEPTNQRDAETHLKVFARIFSPLSLMLVELWSPVDFCFQLWHPRRSGFNSWRNSPERTSFLLLSAALPRCPFPQGMSLLFHRFLANPLS